MTASVARFIESFIPENYNLFLDINRSEKTFTGNVAITGEALDNHISLHQKDLTIHSILLDNESLNFQMDDANEAFHIELPETGVLTIFIEFSGRITDNMTGIYPSYYTYNDEKKEIISTQFESHFAREAFPSVDEPEAKATFDLSLKFDAEEGDIALSNMPEINSHLREETGVWTFETTPRMSTYLLAFGFGALQGKTAKTQNGTEVGVFATVAQAANSVDFALDIAVRVIDFYEDYFQVKYPIPLSYHLALPDFSAGAMENWGLVTYREVYLLVDENSSAESRQQVALVVAHELAHQWFGNLVTMKWWDDLWLNESFANMMEYVSVDAIEPSWNIFEDFQTTGVPHALQRDATDGVQSVHMEVNHPDEINTLFDSAIVYAKGSRLMHMLRRWLGDEAFAKGLKAYFEKHQYNNTVGRDLWNALSDASGKDVSSFMDTWLEQPGYPVVNAKVEDGKLVLTQKQFFIGKGKEVGRKWQIPLNANYAAVPKIMKDEELVVGDYKDLLANNGTPFRLNVGNNSDFIVKYDQTLLDDILSHVDELDAVDKLQLLQDFRLLAEGGQMSYADIVPLLPKFADSTSPIVNNALYRIMTTLRNFVTPGSDEEKQLKKLYDLLSEKQVKRLGLLPKVGESNDDNLTRPYVVSDSLYADNDDTINGLHAIYSENSDNLEGISADIRSAVLVNEVKNFGNMTLFDKLLKKYQETSDASLKQDLCAGITSTKMPEIIDAIVDDFENAQVVKPQDLRAWYR
ncbi:MAG: M1 family metallopeptidase, partial [Streptococcus sp.]|nr:M1 family metallopeptidase [Streptococcus sp.]